VGYYLARAGVLAVEDVPEKDMKFAALALNAEIVNKPGELTRESLGSAETVEQVENADLTKVSGCKNPKAVTILLRGSSQYLLDELERAVVDGTRVVEDAMEDGKLLVGGGAVETELLMKIHNYAATVGGRVQLAIEAYAASFEIIPTTLAENSGFNQLDKLVELKAAHAKGKKHAGLNVYNGKVIDMFKEGVVEPHRSKRQSIQSSAEAAVLLLRVDDMMITQEKTRGPGA
jgi:chaperonin GroEL (HSP60 family)